MKYTNTAGLDLKNSPIIDEIGTPKKPNADIPAIKDENEENKDINMNTNQKQSDVPEKNISAGITTGSSTKTIKPKPAAKRVTPKRKTKTSDTSAMAIPIGDSEISDKPSKSPAKQQCRKKRRRISSSSSSSSPLKKSSIAKVPTVSDKSPVSLLGASSRPGSSNKKPNQKRATPKVVKEVTTVSDKSPVSLLGASSRPGSSNKKPNQKRATPKVVKVVTPNAKSNDSNAVSNLTDGQSKSPAKEVRSKKKRKLYSYSPSKVTYTYITNKPTISDKSPVPLLDEDVTSSGPGSSNKKPKQKRATPKVVKVVTHEPEVVRIDDSDISDGHSKSSAIEVRSKKKRRLYSPSASMTTCISKKAIVSDKSPSPLPISAEKKVVGKKYAAMETGGRPNTRSRRSLNLDKSDQTRDCKVVIKKLDRKTINYYKDMSIKELPKKKVTSIII